MGKKRKKAKEAKWIYQYHQPEIGQTEKYEAGFWPIKWISIEEMMEIYPPKEEGMSQNTDRIINNFQYHQPKIGQAEKYEAIREKAKELAFLLDDVCPEGREKALAFTALEESVMWGNAAIARAVTP